MAYFAVGIDLGGTNIKGGLVRRSEGLIKQHTIPTEAHTGPKHVIDRIAQVVEELVREVSTTEVVGIGIGSPGTINWERTTVSDPPNLTGWRTVNMRTELLERLPWAGQVLLENDANVAGLGSAHYGAGRPFDDFIMVTLGTGVGGAIIYRNKIFRGSTGGAGEIGHMTIDYEGPLDRAGVAGAIEAYLGQRFLSRHAYYRLLNEKSLVHELTGGDLRTVTPKMLSEAALEGDEPARKVLAWAGHKLGCVLGAAINLLDIRKIVVGGGIAQAGDLILEPTRETVTGFVTTALKEDVEVIQETLGNEAGMLGAAHLAFQYLDEHASSAERL